MAAFYATRADDAAERAPARRKLARIETRAGVVVCSRCERAETALSRMRGLLGRDGLTEGEGMFLHPCPSIQTFFMRFPIDVVFLDADREIVGISEDVGPWRFAGARGARSALELPAGTAKRLGLEVGDVLSMLPFER
jgi:uncharacterized membrane protein (UPF0127 family)